MACWPVQGLAWAGATRFPTSAVTPPTLHQLRDTSIDEPNPDLGPIRGAVNGVYSAIRDAATQTKITGAIVPDKQVRTPPVPVPPLSRTPNPTLMGLDVMAPSVPDCPGQSCQEPTG